MLEVRWTLVGRGRLVEARWVLGGGRAVYVGLVSDLG